MRLAILGVLLWSSLAPAQPPRAEVVVRPPSAPGPLDNPLKGWCPYTDANPIRQPYSMVYLYFTWKEVEPEEGRYAFDRWERRAWDVPEAKGKHVVIRPYVDYPSKPTGLPDWLAGQVKMTPYTDHGGGRSPDYDDPRVVAGMERLIAAMGRRYDADPRVGFIELGLLGFWGEWHTYPRTELFARPETRRRVVEAYRKAFPNKILLARTATGFVGDQPWIGFHDDMFPDDTDNGQGWSFLAQIKKSGRAENWKRAAIGGEMVPNQARRWLGESFDRTATMIERGHFSWVGPYGPALDQSTDRAFRERGETLVRKMGYQYRLDEIRHSGTVARGESLSVAIKGVNEGVAPFYYPWPVELALLDESGNPATRSAIRCDLREWLPGPFAVEGQIEAKLPPGRYKLALGILDPGTGRPSIGFANRLTVRNGWIEMSEVAVGASR